MPRNVNFRADQESIGFLSAGNTLYFSIVDANKKPTGGYESMGLIDTFDATVEVTKIDLYTSTQGIRSKFHTVTTEKNATFSIGFRNFSNKQIAKYCYGDMTSVAANPTSTETIQFWAGKVSLVSGAFADTGAVTLTTGTTPVTLVEGVDYELNLGSIYWYPREEAEDKGSTATIVDGADVLVAAPKKAVDEIQAFTKDSLEVALYLEGYNIADLTKRLYKVEIPLAQLDPTTMPFIITEDFGTFTVTGSMLASPFIEGEGLSKFMKVTSVK